MNALTFDGRVVDYCGRGKTIMIEKLVVLILAATLLAGCFAFESPPQNHHAADHDDDHHHVPGWDAASERWDVSVRCRYSKLKL